MKPTEIAITRKFNLGNYQTIDIHVRATLDQNEDLKKAITALEQIINDYWNDRTQQLLAKAKAEDIGKKVK
jgi:predicted Zn-dependent protease with MMP-like domain